MGTLGSTAFLPSSVPRKNMILVTGGAGFIGSNIAAALAERGQRVAVCDRLRRGDKWRNVAKLPLRDIVDPQALLPWLEEHASEVQAMVHMGAISATTETDADLITEVNFRLSLALWRWCARHARRFIYASSAATYGAGTQGFDDDGDACGSHAAAAARIPTAGASTCSTSGWRASCERRPAAAAVGGT